MSNSFLLYIISRNIFRRPSADQFKEFKTAPVFENIKLQAPQPKVLIFQYIKQCIGRNFAK